tara:strand:+ start:357 stop:524 length:168 start_codon:yes stop_codon:yes gene_type:complete
MPKLLDQLQEKGCKEEVDVLREEILDRGPSRCYQTGMVGDEIWRFQNANMFKKRV